MACIYGNIMKIDTTGASEETARQDKLTVKGVEASKKLAEHDLARLEKYKGKIISVGKAKQMDPAVIAAIISRESRAGAALVNGWDPKHTGFGLMQVDKINSPVGAWDSEQHLTQTTEILVSFIKRIKVNFPSWTQEQCFKGGISAYNGGVGNIKSYEPMDVGTPGGDYANDVVARAQWLNTKGY